MNNNNSINNFPLPIGIIHFTGIGGIGMSGIAEILHELGYKVQGSDLSNNANIQRLRSLGVKIKEQNKDGNLDNVSVIVRSTAIKDTNPEISEARSKNIPVIHRSEMLAELMRLKTSIAIAGSHGKTTTTALVDCLFSYAKMDSTVINGGILHAYGSNAKLGKSNWLIAEADESDGSFLRLPAYIGVVTNIDPEHMDHYGNFETLLKSFKTFINNLPFYGFVVMCNDHEEVAKLAIETIDRKVITYGIDSDNTDIVAHNIRVTDIGSLYDIKISDRTGYPASEIKDINLAIPGKHNILNNLAAIGIAIGLKVEEEKIKNAFQNFQGVSRRFTRTGQVNGVSFIDDYAHHPKEISVTLKTAKQLQEKNGHKVIAIVQPHRYTRLQDLFEDFSNCFSDADHVIVTPVFEAGEEPIENINHKTLAQAIENTGHNSATICDLDETIIDKINSISNNGDMVVFLGAGNITLWAHDIPKKIA